MAPNSTKAVLKYHKFIFALFCYWCEAQITKPKAQTRFFLGINYSNTYKFSIYIARLDIMYISYSIDTFTICSTYSSMTWFYKLSTPVRFPDPFQMFMRVTCTILYSHIVKHISLFVHRKEAPNSKMYLYNSKVHSLCALFRVKR